MVQKNKLKSINIVIIVLVLVICSCSKMVKCKYLEGTLRTRDNWAFLARFCFLSEEGEFEYHFEFNEDQGDPNLLLYFDEKDQWPAVYKSNKTCEERESVLKIKYNQIVNLTTSTLAFREFSGCRVAPLPPTTPTPKYTLSVPTLKPNKKVTVKKGVIKFTTTTIPIISTTVPTETSTVDAISSTVTDYLSTTLGISTITTNNDVSTTIFNDGTTIQFSTTESTEFAYETIFSNNGHSTVSQNSLEEISSVSTGTIPTKAPIKKRHLINNINPITRNQRFGRTVICGNSRRFRTARERWWFLAISNCNGTKGIDIKYRILMTNGQPGDYWRHHFSADEFYVLPVLMAFSIAYSFLMLGIVFCSMELKSRQLLHTTYKIFVFSCVFQLFGILFHSCSYLKYAVTGIESNRVKRFGSVLMGISETSFLLLLLLLAKGYTITRGRLPVKASIKLTIFMCLYVMTYVILFIYEAEVFDPGEVLYLYDSPAGYGLIMLRVLAWCMFVYSTIFTLKHYPEKSNFYYPFNIFGTVWFIAGPAFILSANTYIDKWVRESVVCAVLLFIAFGGHLMFLLLTMPSVANKNFPYHVRTTQIGVMEVIGNAGNSTIEQFGHHSYEPSQQTVIIPLTKKTEELFGGVYASRGLQRNGHIEYSEELPTQAKDVTVENVLAWSLAKNTRALEINNFDRFKRRSSVASENSRRSSDISVPPNTAMSRSSSLTNHINLENNNSNSGGTYDDYVKDVPIELFTVSRMVISTTNNLAKTPSPRAQIRELN